MARSYDQTEPGRITPVVIVNPNTSAAVDVATNNSTVATATQSSVTAAAADTVILVANTNRKGATIENDSTAALNLLLGSGTSSATVRTLQIAAGGYYEVPFGYTGAIKGIWTSATGAARVTEFT